MSFLQSLGGKLPFFGDGNARATTTSSTTTTTTEEAAALHSEPSKAEKASSAVSETSIVCLTSGNTVERGVKSNNDDHDGNSKIPSNPRKIILGIKSNNDDETLDGSFMSANSGSTAFFDARQQPSGGTISMTDETSWARQNGKDLNHLHKTNGTRTLGDSDRMKSISLLKSDRQQKKQKTSKKKQQVQVNEIVEDVASVSLRKSTPPQKIHKGPLNSRKAKHTPPLKLSAKLSRRNHSDIQNPTFQEHKQNRRDAPFQSPLPPQQQQQRRRQQRQQQGDHKKQLKQVLHHRSIPSLLNSPMPVPKTSSIPSKTKSDNVEIPSTSKNGKKRVRFSPTKQSDNTPKRKRRRVDYNEERVLGIKDEKESFEQRNDPHHKQHNRAISLTSEMEKRKAPPSYKPSNKYVTDSDEVKIEFPTTSFEMSEGQLRCFLAEDELERYKKAVKRSSSPHPASAGYMPWKKWTDRRHTRAEDGEKSTVAIPLPNSDESSEVSHNNSNLFSQEVDTHLKVLYHLAQAHLARGDIKEALSSCHVVLLSSYKEARKMLTQVLLSKKKHSPTMVADLMLLREKIAGFWCLYAHCFIQIAETDTFLNYGGGGQHFHKIGDNAFSGRLAALNYMEESLWNQALSTLSHVSSCLFVGNHAALTIAQSRIRLKQRQHGRLRPFPSEESKRGKASYFENSVSSWEHWRNNLGLSLQICKDGIERASPTAKGVRTPPHTRVTYNERISMDNIHDINTTTKRASSVLSALEDKRTTALQDDSFWAVLKLPQRLENSLREMRKLPDQPKTDDMQLPYLFFDPPTTRLICEETNCLSRLKEHFVFSELSKPQMASLSIDLARKSSRYGARREVIAWDNFLFFQSMNVVLVDSPNPRLYIDVPKHLTQAPVFFRPECSTAEWAELHSVDGYTKFSSEPVYSNVSYLCHKCGQLLQSESEYELHNDSCSAGGVNEARRVSIRRDCLHEIWLDLPRAISSRSGQSLRHTHSKAPRNKCTDVECACRKCSMVSCVNKNVSHFDEQRCWKDFGKKGSDRSEAKGAGKERCQTMSQERKSNRLKKAKHKSEEKLSWFPESSGSRRGIDRGGEFKPKQKYTGEMICLSAAFDAEVSEEENDASPLINFRTNDVATARPRVEMVGKKSLRSGPAGNRAPLFELEFACTKCCLAGFRTEETRDMHERVCRGISGINDASVDLDEDWLVQPSASSKNAHTEIPARPGALVLEVDCVAERPSQEMTNNEDHDKVKNGKIDKRKKDRAGDRRKGERPDLSKRHRMPVNSKLLPDDEEEDKRKTRAKAHAEIRSTRSGVVLNSRQRSTQSVPTSKKKVLNKLAIAMRN